VRTPLKCAHGQGLCATCFGLAEDGKLHEPGVNIGVLASQAMGEPATQLSMDSFHTGGIAAGVGAGSVDRLTRLRQLLEMPDKVKNEAALSRVSGRIHSVKKDAAGGVDVFVETKGPDEKVEQVRHYVPAKLVREDITPGMTVRRGDTLSHGVINPHRYLDATKDIHAVQNMLASELHSPADDKGKEGLYAKEGVRRRNIEVVVRNVTNLTRVKDPGHSEWVPGDIVPRTVVEEFNRAHPDPFHHITHEPILKGTGEIPHLINRDWMARLNYQQLHTTMQQAAAMGLKSELHGTHPIPSLAYGSEFGRPPPGTPKHHY
jgi:DNA-directed RNA polymerase subunit beta'